MHEMSRLKNALDSLARLYRDEIEPDRMELYLDVLSTVPTDDALIACAQWAQSDNKYMPYPGQLRVLALELPSNPRSSAVLQQRADQAWRNLRGSATSSAYNRWALQDPITKQVWQMMGGGYTTPVGFGQWDGRFEEQKHRQFVQSYLDLAIRYDRLPPLLTAQDYQFLEQHDPVDGIAAVPLDDSEQSTEDYRQYVKEMVAQLQATLAMPSSDVPRHYQTYVGPIGTVKPYVPSMTPEQLEARKALLLRQARQVMAVEKAHRMQTFAAEDMAQGLAAKQGQ